MKTLNWRDLVKGLVVAVVAGFLISIKQALDTGANVDFKIIGLSALSTLIAYLLKNVFTNEDNKLFGKI